MTETERLRQVITLLRDALEAYLRAGSKEARRKAAGKAYLALAKAAAADLAGPNEGETP